VIKTCDIVLVLQSGRPYSSPSSKLTATCFHKHQRVVTTHKTETSTA